MQQCEFEHAQCTTTRCRPRTTRCCSPFCDPNQLVTARGVGGWRWAGSTDKTTSEGTTIYCRECSASTVESVVHTVMRPFQRQLCACAVSACARRHHRPGSLPASRSRDLALILRVRSQVVNLVCPHNSASPAPCLLQACISEGLCNVVGSSADMRDSRLAARAHAHAGCRMQRPSPSLLQRSLSLALASAVMCHLWDRWVRLGSS